jgi:branched-chain amino acid transport system permease protein
MSLAKAFTKIPSLDYSAAFQQGFFAAIIAIILAFPLAGITIDENVVYGAIIQRWDYVGIAALIVFVGRFLITLFRQHSNDKAIDARPNRLAIPESARDKILNGQRYIGAGALAFAVIFPFISSTTWLDLATIALIYVALGWGLNIVVGLAGLLDLGYVAFYAIGAYTFGLLSMYYDISFWMALPLAAVAACFFALLIGFPILRLRGDYLAIVTLGFSEIVRIVLTNWTSLTMGPNGITNIPRPTLFGLDFSRRTDAMSFHEVFAIDFDRTHVMVLLYFIILGLAILINWFSLRIRKLPLGRAWEAMREDEIACRSLGINLPRVKLSAYVIGATIAGLVGAFFATKQAYISPESFTFLESAIILAIVVLGGMRSQTGIFFAAIVITLLPELTRELQDYRMLVFGAAMVIIMIWKPSGLVTYREPTIQLPHASQKN